MKYDINKYAKLEKYLNLLLEWNEKFNLIAPSTVENAWERHFVDSLQLSEIIDRKSLVYDLGSGAGFPGMVLSAIGYNNIFLIEKLQKKCLFLNEVKKQLYLNVHVENKNIKDLKIKQQPVFTSRALASLIKTLDMTAPFFKTNPEYVLLKGEKWEEEVKDAKTKYTFDLETINSITSEKSMILVIKNVRLKK